MNTAELKKLAEAATPIDPELYGDRYFNDDFSRCDLTKEQDAFLRAANPAAILKLLAINAELVEALKEISTDYADRFDLESPSTNPGIKSSIAQARAALAKAEGGEL